MKKLNKYIILMLILSLTGCATVNVKPPFEWDETYASPGTELILKEQTRRASGNKQMGTIVIYEIRATGFLPEEALFLWVQKGLDYSKLPATISSDGLVFDRLSIGSYMAGEALDIALASETTRKRAHAKTIPFPILAKGNGRCSASAEILSETGDLFLISFNGFDPREDIQVTLKYKKEILTPAYKVSKDGKSKFPILFGKGDRGKASVTASGMNCTVSLEYNVGKDAIEIQ